VIATHTLVVLTDPGHPVPEWSNEHLRVVEVAPDALEHGLTSPKLTALVIGCVDDPDARIAAAMRADELQPNVPLILLGCDPRELRPLGTLAPDFVISPTSTAAELTERLDEFVHGSIYTPELVSLTTAEAENALGLGFDASARIRDSFIRTSRIPGHPINAVVPMCGPLVSGRVSVSASLRAIVDIHRRLLPGEPVPTENDLEDVVAEMANQVTGALKRGLEARGLHIDQGVPWTYVGERCPVRYRTRTASVLLEARCEDIEETILIDLALDSFRTALGEECDEPHAACGELAFL